MQNYNQEMVSYIEAAFKDGKIEQPEWDFLVNLAKSNSLNLDEFKKDMVHLYCHYFVSQTGEITKKDVAKIKKLADLIDLPEAKSDLWLTKQIDEIETKFHESVKEAKKIILGRVTSIYGYSPTGKYGKAEEDSSFTDRKRQDFIKSISPSELNEYFALLLVLKDLKEENWWGYDNIFNVVLKEARSKFPQSKMLRSKLAPMCLILAICAIPIVVVIWLLLPGGFWWGVLKFLSACLGVWPISFYVEKMNDVNIVVR